MDFQKDTAGVLRFPPWQKERYLVHGFTTRSTGNFRQLHSLGFLSSVLDIDGMNFSTLKQVHSNRLIIKRGEESDERSEADGLLTNVPGHVLGVRSADCFAVLLVDRSASCIAAVHAGWRGTAGKIVSQAVESMVREFEASPEQIEALIGPGIEPCCFEVGEDTAVRFSDRFVVYEGKKTHVDLGEANRTQLLDAGLSQSNIHSVQRCSCCEREAFFSYRREGESTGRMLAFIGLRPSVRS